jgi:hypothetical protein
LPDATMKERLRRPGRGLRQRLRRQPGPEELTSALDALVDSGSEPAELVDRLRQLTEVAGFKRASGIARRVLLRVEGLGDVENAVSIGLELARSVDHRYARLAHEAALRCGDLVAADAAAAIAEGQRWMTPALTARFAVERSLAVDDVPAALELLQQAPIPRDRQDSLLYVRALSAVGRHADVLAYVRSSEHGLDATTAALHEADALRWLDRTEEADRLVTRLADDGIEDRRVLTRMRDWGLVGDAGGELAARVRRMEEQTSRSAGGLTKVLALYWELDLVDDAARVARAIESNQRDEDSAPLAPMTRLLLARYHYARREFDRAIELIDGLMRSPRRLEAEKLRARIQIERGDVEGALAISMACARPQGWMDEVSFAALLHQRRYSDAFALVPNRRERTPFVAIFGERAELDGSELEFVGSRFVIAQGGPGDGIRFAGTYHALRPRSTELSVTCDPRLSTLLRRSFPEIEFLPVERFNGRRPGGAGPDSPPRSGDVLFQWMTAEARDRAMQCDRVVLERALYPLTLDPGGKAPYAPYLLPRGDLVAGFAPRWSAARRRVGIVWRSELRGPAREIHYLAAREAAELCVPDDMVVCLQHDATATERDEFSRFCPADVEFVDDVDLRNDFESTAALLAGLDVVVGIGTTMTELSGALGTRTVLLQPTHLGTWRAIDDAGQDFWHQSTVVVGGDPPSDRRSLIRRARAAVGEV